MACRVIKNEQGQVIKIFQKNGENSQLFDQISEVLPNPDIAYATYMRSLVETKSELDPRFEDIVQYVTDARKNPLEYKRLILQANFKNSEDKLLENLDSFFQTIQIDINTLDNIVDTTTGKPVNLAAKAKLGQKIIEIARGKATLQDLSEEGAHFLVEILRQQNAPLYASMEKQIRSYQIYQNMLQEDNFYYQKYKGDEDFIKREAMAKVIAMQLMGKSVDSNLVGTTTQESPEKLSRLQRWGQRVLNWIKKIWGALAGNPFVQSSQLILNNSLDEYLAAHGLLIGKDRAANIVLPNIDMPSVAQPENTESKRKSIIDKLVEYDVYKIKDDIPVGEKDYWKLLAGESDMYIQRYVHINDPTKILEIRMTDAAQLLYLAKHKKQKLPYQSKVEKEFWDDLMAKRAARGSAGHNTLEALLNYHTKGKMRSDETTLSQIQQKYSFTEAQFKLLNANLKALIKHATKYQDEIDPSQKPIFKAEQFVINKTEDTGGTIDLLVLYSNGNASIYDYKFSTPGKHHLQYKEKRLQVLKSDPWSEKIEQYDSQMANYIQALKEKYGVNEIIESRIIPVAIFYGTKNNKPTTEILKMKMGGTFLREYYTQDEKDFLKEDPDAGFLEPIPIAGEKTGIESLDRLIEKEKDRLTLLIKERSGADYTGKQALTKRIAYSRNILKRLTLKKQVDSAIIEAWRVRKRADEGLGKNGENEFDEKGNPNTKFIKDKELEQIYIDLKHFEGFLKLQDLMGYYKKIQTSEENQGRKNETLWKNVQKEVDNIKDLLSKVGVLQLTIEAVENKIVERALTFGKKLGVEGLTSYNTTIEGFGKNLVPLSAQTNPYLRAIYLTKRDIHSKITQVTKELAMEIEDLQNDILKEYGNIGVKIYDKLINPYTMNFYSKWTDQWREEREHALSTGNVAWVKQHFEINAEFYEKKGKYNFHTLKANLEKVVEETEQSDISKTAELKRLIARWDVKTSEVAWLNPKNLSGNFGLKLKAGVKSKYKSKEQKEIEANPVLLRFREYHEKMAWKFSQMLGIDLGAGYIADVQKSLFDAAVENNFNFNQLAQAGLDLFQVRQHEQGFGAMDENGEFIRQVPRLHTIQLFDKNNRPDNSLKTRELGKSLYLLGKAAYQYKFHMEVLPQLNLLKRMLTDKFPAARELQTDIFGGLVIDNTNQVRKKVAKANAETITDVIDLEIYGRSLKTKDIVSANRVSRNKTILSLKQYHSLTTLGLSLPVALGAFGAGTVAMHTQATKGIHYTHRQLLSAEKSLLSLDPKIRGLFEFFELSLVDEVHRRGDLLSTNWRAKYMQSDRFFEFLARADRTIDAVLTTAMAKNHGIHPKTGELMRLKELPEGTKSIYDSIELVQDPKWKYGSVRDRYKVTLKGFQRKEATKEMTKAQLSELDIQNQLALNAWGTFQARVQRMSGKIKGTMNINDKALFNQHLIARLFMHYRTWLPSLAHERFAGLRYDHVMDHYDEGTWRSFFKNVGPGKTFDSVKQGLDTEVSYLEYLGVVGQDLLKIGIDIGTFGTTNMFSLKEDRAKLQFEEFLIQHLGDPKYMKGNKLITESDPEYEVEFQKFLELKRANLRAGLSELRAVIMLMLLLMGLAADWDEDGDIDLRESWSGRKLHNVLNRVYREVAFFLDPTELTGPRASGIPLISLGQQVMQLSSNTLDEFFDSVTGRDDTGDKYNKGYSTLKLIPGQKLIRPLEPFKADRQSRTD